MILGVVFLLLLYGTKADLDWIYVDESSQQFVDSFGRERFFHGTNIVQKVWPYYPNLTESDFETLSSYGLNIIRLGVMWAGAVPDWKNVDEQYLAKVMELIKSAGKYGIYTLVDSHQDLFSESFCGDGSPILPPEWIKGFPFPVASEYTINKTTNTPDDIDCARKLWSDYYFSNSVQKAFEILYSGKEIPEIKESFFKYWSAVSRAYKSLSEVIGYELINEPYPGLTNKNPLLFYPPKANKILENFYVEIHDVIRKNDDEHIVFYEPVTWTLIKTGFTGKVGGKNYSNRTALSYHFYNPPNMLSPSYTVSLMHLESKKLKIGRMLTEFWSRGNISSFEEFDNTLRACYENLHSWIGWQYDCYIGSYKTSTECKSPFWTPRSRDANRLTDQPTLSLEDSINTYAHAVSGNTLSMIFDPASLNFQMQYRVVGVLKSQETLIYINRQFHYPNGVSVTVYADIVSCNVTWQVSGTNFITVKHDPKNCLDGQLITVKISPKINQPNPNFNFQSYPE